MYVPCRHYKSCVQAALLLLEHGRQRDLIRARIVARIAILLVIRNGRVMKIYEDKFNRVWQRDRR
jgi:hypothetical protein